FNQLDKIKKDLFDLLHQHGSVAKQVTNATNQIIESHREFLQEDVSSAINTDDENIFDETKWKEIKEQLNILEEKEMEFDKEFTSEVDQTLKNAYLMPAKLRDLAHDFLESQD